MKKYILHLLLGMWGLSVLLPAATTIQRTKYSVQTPLFGTYAPEDFNSLDALPKIITEQVADYLRNSFPPETIKRISFRRGCVVEGDKAAKAGFPQPTPLSYCLVYSVRLEHDLIEFCDFLLWVSDKGQIMTKPQLPAGSCGRNFDFLSGERITAIAKTALGEWNYALIDYSKKYETLFWRIGRRKAMWTPQETEEVLCIDACNGRIITHETYPVSR